MSEQSADGLERRIAEDMMEYVREHPEVYAEGAAYGYCNLRWHDDEWQAVKVGGYEHRLPHYLTGRIMPEERAIEWFICRPIEIRPREGQKEWINDGEDLWSKVEDHDVFADADRCYWCGDSESNVGLSTHLTVSNDVIDLCPDCFETWDKQDEIVKEDGEILA